MVVFVLGGPGAGKGTQCKLLAKKFNFVHLSAGDLLREERARPGSQYGDLINEYIEQGKIVPMHITIGLLRRAMLEAGEERRFLVDGFPRDVAQGVEFERIVCPSKAMLFFSCPESVLTERLLERGLTSQRIDDNAASIHKRLETYRIQTLPVREWASAAGKLHDIDSSGPVPIVFDECCHVIEAILRPTQ